jgi:AAA family ATP:ADP antiporter
VSQPLDQSSPAARFAIFERFTNIHRGERLAVLTAGLYFFCILTALMILRPARDALGMQRGMDEVRWLFNATLVATLLVNPVFGALVARFRRMTFITFTNGFFALNLFAFYLLLTRAPEAVGERSGQVFYVWMSVFNLFVTAVFWALMADRFTFEQSKRLFGFIAVGGTAGAITGSWMADQFVERLGTPAMLLIAIGSLCAGIAAAFALTRIAPAAGRIEREARGESSDMDRATIGGSAIEGLKAVFRSKYLFVIVVYVLITAVMVTLLYFTRLQMVAERGQTVDERAGIFARIDLITQVATIVLQALVAGHLMKRLGVAVTLAILPVVVALGYVGLAIVGSLAALIVFEAVFKAIQRALMRPARETLFTVVSREDKYKSKAFIDTFGYRAGDAVGAQTEKVLGGLGMGLAALPMFAVPLAIVWGAMGIWLGRTQRGLAAADDKVTS